MANVLFTRKNTSETPLSNIPVVDGQLIFDTVGNGKMYLDNGTDRLEMGGAIEIDDKLDATSTNAIQNKAIAGVMLSNLSEIETLTKSGFLADGLAIKELDKKVGVWLGAYTITAGETSYTISDSSITTDSTIDVYSNVYGFNPTDITVASGSITLTFDAQETDLSVKVRVM